MKTLADKIPHVNIWLIALFVKVILAAIIPLSADEAYYWVWSKHLQLSYYDHPAMVAWLFWLAQGLEPFGQLVRLPFVLLGHLSLLPWLVLLKDRLSGTQVKWWLYLALFSPLIGFGSMIGTPDVPLLFFWSVSFYLLVQVLSRPSALNYSLLGASLGLGFCSKYHIVIFIPILVAYLSLQKAWAKVRWHYLGLLILFGLIFSLPVLVWNAQNEWISFLFQLNHGLGESHYEFEWTYSYILGQILILFPPLIYCAFRARNVDALFHYFAWGPLLFFFLTSFKAGVELNWPATAYPAFFVLAVAGSQKGRSIWASCGFWLFAYILSFSIFVLAPKTEFKKYFERLDEVYQLEPLYGLQEKYSPLYASTYQMASKIWYETKEPIYKLHARGRRDFYDDQAQSMPRLVPFYVIMPKGGRMPEWLELDYSYEIVESPSENFNVYEVTYK